MSRKSRYGETVMAVQRKIARCLHRGEPVPEGLAKNLADLLWKEQRQRPRRGELS